MDKIFLSVGLYANDFLRFIGANGLVSDHPYWIGVCLVFGVVVGILEKLNKSFNKKE